MLSRNTRGLRTGMITMLVTLLGMSGGCPVAGVRGNGVVPVPDPRQAIEAGDARLTCGISCSGAWGMARAGARQLLGRAPWHDLEALVAQVGYEIDQSYSSGRAVEGLGRASAAGAYDRSAIAAPTKCDAGSNACDGLYAPAPATAGLERLAADAGATAPAPAPPPSGPSSSQAQAQAQAQLPSLAAQAKRPDCVQPGRAAFPWRLRYPREAKRLGQSGLAIVQFIVEADGAVAEDGLRITHSSGVPAIDEAALSFLRGNRFTPGRCNGVPTRMGHELAVGMRPGVDG